MHFSRPSTGGPREDSPAPPCFLFLPLHFLSTTAREMMRPTTSRWCALGHHEFASTVWIGASIPFAFCIGHVVLLLSLHELKSASCGHKSRACPCHDSAEHVSLTLESDQLVGIPDQQNRSHCRIGEDFCFKLAKYIDRKPAHPYEGQSRRSKTTPRTNQAGSYHTLCACSHRRTVIAQT